MNLDRFKNCYAHKNALYVSTTDGNKPCCWFKGGAEASTWAEYQEKISAIDIETGCAHCINAESSGSKWSHRLLYEDNFYKDHDRIFTVGACIDNICNIKCTTCNPTSSSQWITDYDKLGIWDKTYDARRQNIKLMRQGPGKIELIKDAIANHDYGYLKFEFFGGEPLINPAVLEFIDWLADHPSASKMTISFTTNGTTYLERLEYYLTKFDFVTIQCSIDGIGEKFEYLRYLAKWDKVKDNMMRYYNVSRDQKFKFRFGVNYTLSWMNANHFAEYCEWLSAAFPDKERMSQYISRLTHPTYYSVDNLTPEVKASIMDDIRKRLASITQPVIDDSIDFAKVVEFFETSFMPYNEDYYTTPGLFQAGKTMLASLDSIRSTDYTKTFTDILTLTTND
jgi:organic radical activating enzyme